MIALKELCKDFLVPQRDKPKEFGGNIPWCRIEDIEGKYLNGTKSEHYVTEDTVKRMNLKVIPTGAVICSCSASLGVQAILTTPCVTNQTFIGIIPKEELSAEFLYYFLKSRSAYFNKIGTGTTIPYISRKKFEELIIPNISLDEQKNIVKVLEKVERIINLRKQGIAYLDDLIKARFVEMFGDPVINEKHWPTAKLDDVCNGIGDGLHGTPEYDDNGDYPFINGNNLIDGSIVITSMTKMVDERTYQRHYIDLSYNAILISINGTLGKLAFYNGEKVMLGKSACYCNLKPEISREFVYSVMRTNAFADFLETNSTKSTIKNVGLKAMRNFDLILPPQKLQKQFVDFTIQIDKSKAVVQKALDEAQLLFDSLMQQYFG